jgi:hypothetical protein
MMASHSYCTAVMMDMFLIGTGALKLIASLNERNDGIVCPFSNFMQSDAHGGMDDCFTRTYFMLDSTKFVLHTLMSILGGKCYMRLCHAIFFCSAKKFTY